MVFWSPNGVKGITTAAASSNPPDHFAPARRNNSPEGVREAAVATSFAHGHIARITSNTPPSATNQCRKPDGILSGEAPAAIITTPSPIAGQRSPIAASDNPRRPRKMVATATARSANW